MNPSEVSQKGGVFRRIFLLGKISHSLIAVFKNKWEVLVFLTLLSIMSLFKKVTPKIK